MSSSDVDMEVAIRIREIFLARAMPWKESTVIKSHDVYVSVDVVSCGFRLMETVVIVNSQIQEWVQLPLTYQELPKTSFLYVQLLSKSEDGVVVWLGGETYPFFSHRGELLQGKHYVDIPLAAAKSMAQLGTLQLGEGYRRAQVAEPYTWLLRRLDDYREKRVGHEGWLDAVSAGYLSGRLAEVREEVAVGAAEREASRVMVEFASFEYPVIFHEAVYGEELGGDKPCVSYATEARGQVASVSDLDDTSLDEHHMKLMLIRDPEHFRQSGGEALERLKPDVSQRHELRRIVKRPPWQPIDRAEATLLRHFRQFLKEEEPQALTKILRCLKRDGGRDEQILGLLEGWKVGIDYALEMLGKDFRGQEEVRSFALERLNNANDTELLAYLLQLVNALRYSPEYMTGASAQPRLALLLIGRALSNRRLAHYLYWYLMVEKEDKDMGPCYQQTLDVFLARVRGDPGGEALMASFQAQLALVEFLTHLHRRVTTVSGNLERRKQVLREELRAFSTAPFPLPLDPNITVTGIDAEACSIFGSAMAPLRITFTTEDGEGYATIFKCGDDLRQDQLVLQLFSLMDKLLKAQGLDLRLTLYRVLATSSSTGFMQFVENTALRTILQGYDKRNPIQAFLRERNEDRAGPYEISSTAMDNLVRSMAGSCVLTFLLGVGDRHNDNILVQDSGRMFHVDFGYILGMNPPFKAQGPAIKLNKKMVAAIGGMSKDGFFHQFKSFCCEAYNILRSNANLILNLFSLMVDANIPGIVAVGGTKSLRRIYDKFNFSLSDEAAIQWFQDLIQSSIVSVWRDFWDGIHDSKQRYLGA